MSAPGYILGRCSACGGRAERSPTSTRWWHSNVLVCPQTSMLFHRPVRTYGDGTIGPTDATEQPARFVEDTSW
jgi:hypothetical protein